MALETLPALPAVAPLYAKAAMTSRGRGGESLPDLTLRVEDVRVDRARLAAYQRITGYDVSDTLPQTYPWVLAFGLQTDLMTRPGFPVPVVGLVHLENRVRTHRRLDAGEPLTLEVSATTLAPHRRGRSVETSMVASVDGETVWECASVYLARGSGTAQAPRTDPPPDAPTGPPRAVWRLPGDLGRRYAAVSGDVNPIHLHPLTARAMGFPRPIAHGMWTSARVLAALGRTSLGPSASRVWFTRPVPLPSAVELVTTPSDTGVLAAVRSRRDAATTHAVLTLER